MKKIFLVLFFFLGIYRDVSAQGVEMYIEGNAEQSENSILIDTSSDINHVQDNQLFVNNQVEVKSNTGGNVINESSNGSIKTGDPKTSIQIINVGGANVVTGKMCCDPSPTPSLKPTPTLIPTQTEKPSTSTNTNNSTSSNENHVSSIGGDILGLANTSSYDLLNLPPIPLKIYTNNLSDFSMNITEDNIPKRILIPDLKIQLPIIPSELVDGYWEVSDNAANYGIGSGYLNEPGNIVIFAHARDHLFGNLGMVKIGNEIEVSSASVTKKFIVKRVNVVDESQISNVANDGVNEEVLTLFTCIPNQERLRLLVQAVLQN